MALHYLYLCCSTSAASVMVHAHSATRTAAMEPLILTQVDLRFLSCPAWVPKDAVFELLCSIALVVDFVPSCVKVGDRAVHNLQYVANLKDITPAMSPTGLPFKFSGRRYPYCYWSRVNRGVVSCAARVTIHKRATLTRRADTAKSRVTLSGIALGLTKAQETPLQRHLLILRNRIRGPIPNRLRVESSSQTLLLRYSQVLSPRHRFLS